MARLTTIQTDNPIRLWPLRMGAATSLLLAAVPMGVLAQSPASQQPQPSSSAGQAAPANAQQNSQKIAPVTTTVVVHGDSTNDYAPGTLEIGTLGGLSATLEETPLSVTITNRALLNDQGARLLSDVVKNDASIGEDYAPVGYYGDYEIRGFPIDLATGLEINGMTIAGEQDVPLENKESVEFLKGIAGVESGVASAGGLINFVTKRPAAIEALDLATDHRGTSYGAVDFGHFFGNGKQVGARLNLAGERIKSYLDGADGWRAVGAGAADWKIDPKTILKADFEYQHKLERDGSGLQLLGGTVVPDLNRIYPSTMLGLQPWVKPNTFDTYNTSVRFDRDLPRGWRVFAETGFSHSLIDDNVIYAYGCGYEPECQPGGAPAYFFAPNGGYDIYDYRDPGELRIDAQAEALITGQMKTGAITHDLAGGGVLFLRSVHQPGYVTLANPATVDVSDGAVYTYVGSENIYQPIEPVAMESPHQFAGPRRLWEDNHQSALIAQDRVHLPWRIELLAGGRFDWLRDHNYSLSATAPSTAPTLTDKLIWLPQYAAKFSPRDNLMLYSSYSVLLSLGPEAPWWVTDANQFLDAFFTRQAEVGAKYEPDRRILLSTALFHMRAPFFYPKDLGVNAECQGTAATASSTPLCFLSNGHETHDGVELNVQGRAASRLQITASAAAIRALSSDTGTPSFDHRQVINVPHLRTDLFADVTLSRSHGLYLMPGWSYTGRKEATRDDHVSVSGYNLFNLGARYTPGGENGHVTLRLYADNIFDKRYWKDTGGQYGDTFLWLGAPSTVRLSAHYTF